MYRFGVWHWPVLLWRGGGAEVAGHPVYELYVALQLPMS